MDFLYKYNWSLLIGSELLTWIFVGLFIITRYKYGFIRMSQLSFSVVILCTAFQGLLAGLSYYYTGSVSFYQIVIVMLILYGSTIGKKDFKRLDRYLQQKIHMQRNNFHDDIYTYIKIRRRLFLIHTVVYFSFLLLYSGENELIAVLSFLWTIVYCFEVCINVFYSLWLWKNK